MGGKPMVTLKSDAFLSMFKSTDPEKAATTATDTLPLSCLTTHLQHKFKPYNDVKKQAMVESIQRHGVLEL